jgi:hypothetical protein
MASKSNILTKAFKILVISAGVLGVTLMMGGLASATDSAKINWSSIPAKTVKLFYPGESTYQWLRSKKHKRAQRQTIKGESCVSCHEGEEAEMGSKLVIKNKLEPKPIAGKNGLVDLAVQAAHDSEYVYFRFNWKTNANREGRMHNMVRFDGKGWKFYGSHRANKKVIAGKSPAIYEDRLSIMIDDGKVPGFAKQGCWVTCHNGMRDTPKKPTKATVKAHPYLGKVLKKSDIRKYLPATRTDKNASWAKTKSATEIAALKAKGQFLDLMQWRVARSNPAGGADDGYVLQYRIFDKGKKVFSWNLNKKTMMPKYMFDAAKTGYKALREEDFANPTKQTAIIREVNAKKYDPNAGWKVGDILPGRLLTKNTKGSAGDNDSAKGVWKGGAYTVVFRRKLDTGHPTDDKIMKVGGVYDIGLAVHDDNVTTRFHHVSFPLTLGIGAKADIQAVTLK